MKKLLLLLSLLLITSCEDSEKKAAQEKAAALEQKVAVLEKKLSNEEREKLLRERYKDLNDKTLELVRFYFDTIQENFAPLGLKFSYEADLTKEGEKFSSKIYLFVEENNQKHQLPVFFTDIITVNDDLAKNKILGKIERRINLDKENPEFAELPQELKRLDNLFNMALYISLFEDGRNLAEYIFTPFSMSDFNHNTKEGFKLEFKGLEIKSEYLQKDLNNPLLIGEREFKFKGFSTISTDYQDKVIFEPFSAKLSSKPSGELELLVNNLKFSYREKKEADKDRAMHIGNLKLSATLKKVPTSVEDLIKLLLPNAKLSFEFKNFVMTENNQEFRLDNFSILNNSIIRENDFDLNYKFIYEIKNGFCNSYKNFPMMNKKPNPVCDDNFDFSNAVIELNIPKIELASLNHLESFIDTQNTQQLELAGYSLLTSLVKNNFNLGVGLMYSLSYGDIDLKAKLNIPIPKDWHFNIEELWDKKLNMEEFKKFDKFFTDNFNLKISANMDEKFLNHLLSSIPEAQTVAQKLNIDTNKTKYDIEVKGKEIFIDNKLVDLDNLP